MARRYQGILLGTVDSVNGQLICVNSITGRIMGLPFDNDWLRFTHAFGGFRSWDVGKQIWEYNNQLVIETTDQMNERLRDEL